MKVLFLTWEFPPVIAGGLGMACYGMVRALLERGVAVTLLLPGTKPCIIEMTDIDHVDQLPCRSYDEQTDTWHSAVLYEQWRNQEPDVDATVSTESHNPYAAPALSPLRLREMVESVINHVDFDVIHAHDWLSFEAGLYAKGISGKPLVCHVHSTEYDRACGRGNERIHEYEHIGIALADRVIAVSNYTASALQKHYGADPEAMRVVHNAYFLEQSPIINDRVFREPVVLFMGRMTCQKGPDIFFEMARSVLSVNTEVRFVMAGQGDMLHSLIHRSARYGMKNSILFTGFLNRTQVNRVLGFSDIFVAPSVSDPFNITVLEAMSRGTAVLVSRQSGVTELVKHVLTADYWDVQGMSRKILSLLRKPARMHTLGELGKAEAAGIDWANTALQLVEVYGELL